MTVEGSADQVALATQTIARPKKSFDLVVDTFYAVVVDTLFPPGRDAASMTERSPDTSLTNARSIGPSAPDYPVANGWAASVCVRSGGPGVRQDAEDGLQVDRYHLPLAQPSPLAVHVDTMVSRTHQQLLSRHPHEPDTTLLVERPHILVIFPCTECMVEQTLTHPWTLPPDPRQELSGRTGFSCCVRSLSSFGARCLKCRH